MCNYTVHGPHYAMHNSGVNIYLVSASIESASHTHLRLSWLVKACSVYMGKRLQWPVPQIAYRLSSGYEKSTREGLCMWIFPVGSHIWKVWILHLFHGCVFLPTKLTRKCNAPRVCAFSCTLNLVWMSRYYVYRLCPDIHCYNYMYSACANWMVWWEVLCQQPHPETAHL